MTTPDHSEEWLDDVLDAVVSDVQAAGYFDVVNKHEPKAPPGYGLSAAVWIQGIRPLALRSGLSSTSGLLHFRVRFYKSMTAEPQDEIDPQMIKAISNVFRRYHESFTFDGAISNVDIFGEHGIELAGQAGYLEVGGVMYRIFDIDVPCVINDLWPQTA